MSTRKNPLCSFLSRLALCGLAAPLILLSPALVRADAITTFAVSGTAGNGSGMKLGSCANGATCAFSGLFKVDTTTGTVESGGIDITLPGLPTLDLLGFSGPSGDILNLWAMDVLSPNGNGIVELDFTTAPKAGSLVGFTGGSLFPSEDGEGAVYFVEGGSITPVSTVITPEPSSLVLFASGMLVLGLTRRFGKKVGHPLSA